MSGHLFQPGRRALIVAEVGNNHEGEIDVALELVNRAAEAGADAVKFQTYRTELFVNRQDAARWARLKRYELTPDDFSRLAQEAHSKGLLFVSTPLDLESARMLEPLVDAYKIASGDITFSPLIRQIAETGKAVMLSTGASDLAEVRTALTMLQAGWPTAGAAPEFAVLHCVSCYPAPDDQLSLRAIAFMGRALGCPIGYSDHSLGIDAPVFAAAVGACVIEKHFTLDKHRSDFRDHLLSADPADLKELVARVRRFEGMAGDAESKPLQPCEVAMRQPIRRSIVARGDFPAGHELRHEDLLWMRPGTGLAPGEEQRLVGFTLKRPVTAGQPITPRDLE